MDGSKKFFQMDGKAYKTDSFTLSVLASVMQSAKEVVDFSDVAAMMAIGEKYGKIAEVK